MMKDMTGQLISVNVVHRLVRGPRRKTGIDKRPVDGPVVVSELGLDGDKQMLPSHGGPDRALYAYAAEDAGWWAAELDREIPAGRFGENLTTTGIDVTGALIGERWRIGDQVVLEVREPRIPCGNFTHWMGEQRWVRRFTEHGCPGAYLKVIETGSVQAGDVVRVIHRPDHGVTIGDVFPRGEPGAMRALLDSGIDLSDEMRSSAERIAERITGRAG